MYSRARTAGVKLTETVLLSWRDALNIQNKSLALFNTGFFLLFLPQLAAVIPRLYSEMHMNPSHLPHCANPLCTWWSEGNSKGRGRGTPSPSAIQLLGAWPTRDRPEQPLGCRNIQQRNLTGPFLSFSAFLSQTATNPACLLCSSLALQPLLCPGLVTRQGSVPPGLPPTPVLTVSGQIHISTLSQPANDKLKES